jgi:sporulation protein YlmC with PRC-barrel domain
MAGERHDPAHELRDLAGERLDLVYRVLDLQLVDVDGRRCGKVDDVEVAGDPLRATALLAGTGVFPDRLAGRLLPRLARRLVGPLVAGGNVVRIPWEEIDGIDATVQLRRKAGDLGLGRGDDELGPVVGRLMLARRGPR